MTKHDRSGTAADTRPIRSTQRAVSFMVPGKPVGKGRPRAAKRGRHITLYTPEETASYESTVALAAGQAMAGQPLIDGPVDVLMRIALPVPASWSQKKQREALAGTLVPTVKPDMDNVIKAVFDAINGVVWNDDTQVADLRVQRRYGAAPGVSVVVMTLEGY
ncbi:RusA family crossover junction endodeoxyribonuclease [Paracandidimonas lactea]|uniref:RusA family crossover junction endodeoxyribonuclease n=1 Tax=Paracandidimonas lactea TaxID=2895524 RepID=UPI001F20F184|nr:RusA family crossover junction endodeoxyribonuclease [Paracandidimonas lactea]